jgi:putative MFS transporter
MLASARLLEPRHWFLLRVLGVASFFEGYDVYIVAVALPQIRHTFHLSQPQAALWLSVLYVGALPAILFTRRADRFGRRRLLLISILGYTLATGATALTPTIALFVTCQFLARVFANAEVAIAWTMIAEELPAGARGVGFGYLAMLTALGSGLGGLLYGTVFAPNHLTWRWLYVVAIPPLLLVAVLRRRLPESGRFTAARVRGTLAGRWHEILHPPHRRWFALVGTTAFLGALTQYAGLFAIDFMQKQRHLSPSAANLILVGSGALAIPVLVSAGSLSDRFGRKLVGCTFEAIGFLGGLAFFMAAHRPAWLFAALFVALVGQFGAWPTLNAFASELFPTGLRALGGSLATLLRVSGQAVSLVAGSALDRTLGGLPRAAVVLGLGPVVALVLIVVAFPETHGRELEDITGEPPFVPLL